MRYFMITVALTLLSAAAFAQTSPTFRDDFSSQLAGGWQVLSESAANHSLTARPGFLRILTQRGALEEDNHINNLFVREFSGDFFIETRLEFDPQAGQQFAGLLIYESQTNAAALGLAFVSGERGEFRGLVLVSAALANSSVQPPVQRYDESTASNPNVVYLRLLRSGQQIVAGFSENGVSFTDFGSILNAFPDTVRVGVGATNGDFAECGAVCDTPIPADFDYFQITAVGGNGGGGPQLEELAIDGPDQLAGGETGDFTATARYSDDSEVDVTEDALWTLAPPGNGQIDAGSLQAALVPSPRYVTVVATYPANSVGGLGTTAAMLVEIVPQGSTNGLPMCGMGFLPLLPVFVLPIVFGRGRFRRTATSRG